MMETCNQPQGIEEGMTLEYRGDENVDSEHMEIVGMNVSTDSVELVNVDVDADDSFTVPMGTFWSVFPSWSVVENE